jgi:hypothetical protein
MAEHADPAFLADYLAGLPRPPHVHAGPVTVVREDDYRGHHVVITTTYEITVDGTPLPIHIGISNDGMAHAHGLPAYEFASLVDVIRALIEFFPDEFPPAGERPPDPPHHGGHPGAPHHDAPDGEH